jgi:hypothetical protein
MLAVDLGTRDDFIAEEVESKLESGSLDISKVARERDDVLGSPNFISNFIVPLLATLFPWNATASKTEDAPPEPDERRPAA